jgi:Tol biopolymer transport system component
MGPVTRSPYDLATPSWSPDGSHLAVGVQISGVWYIGWIHPGLDQMGVYSTGFGGRQGRYPSHTPSGQIVYVGAAGKTIERINADGSGHKQLYSSTTGVSEPVYSPMARRSPS